MAGNFVYTEEQIHRYFDRVRLPSSSRHVQVGSLSPERQLETLIVLQKHQLMQVPFENTVLHYSWHRVIDLDPEHLFDKIVCSHGRGGYCMENNTLFHIILRTLGYSVYMVGARPYDKDLSRYGGLTHCLNIAVINGSRYAIDVCFGSRVPVLPLRLQDTAVQRHSDPGQMRVRYDSISQALSPDQKWWIYEHRKDIESPWVPQYSFADSEFLFDDICCINWAPAKSPSSFFTQKVVVVKFTTENEVYHGDRKLESIVDKGLAGTKADTGAIDGALILDGNRLRWRKRGDVVWEQELSSETERLDIMSRYFGIAFAPRDVKAIVGTAAAITRLPRLHLQ
ncbi:unnamed protein product [Clonostachys solani]|uniref:Arylamine N-acetyltransferase n=1 Tax=Clonostachys solani TaxID=160281 RepID=A0A9N9ZIU6_9HYPO|nr:unnamed protein product [Clonostachys solani]